MDQIEEYKNQIKSVDEALIVATGAQKDELLDLKSKLLEVISLLEGSKSNDVDDEFTKFQREISKLEHSSDDSSDTSSDSSTSENESSQIDEFRNELSEIISSMEGSKCRAPFSHEWGEMGYHNALIISTSYDQDVESLDNVEVKVMFCNPTCDKMKPCPYFLNGSCKFPDENCRYSHGYAVKFPQIQEFVLPNLETLKERSRCLSRCSDGLWSIATIEQCLENNVFSVKYLNSGNVDDVDADNILPLDDTNNQSYDEEYNIDEQEYESHQDSINNDIDFNFRPVECIEWERHTNGIGSKLMEKMGHVWGQGLGKNSDGRIEPIEAVILPAGKSLDKCIEMRENVNQNGPVPITTRLKLAQEKEQENVKKIKSNPQPRKQNVFDFLNSKISRVKDKHFDIKKQSAKLMPDKSNKDLNVQIFKVGENIKKAKIELKRLQKSLVRNSNSSVKTQVEDKIATQLSILKNLQAEERRISQGIKTQTGHKKLSIF